jgi:hypothetical protein
MNKYEEKYNKIVRELIKKSFPELRKSWIIVSYAGSSYFKHSATVVDFIFLKWIFVYKKSEKYSKEALIGMFAHELSHLAIIKNMKFFEMFFYFLKWPFSKNRRADLEVIRRGFGKERIKLEKFSLKGKTKEQIEKRYKRGYLSLEEIKQEMKELR